MSVLLHFSFPLSEIRYLIILIQSIKFSTLFKDTTWKALPPLNCVSLSLSPIALSPESQRVISASKNYSLIIGSFFLKKYCTMNII